MATMRKGEAETLERARVALNNATQQPEIVAALDKEGYTAEVIAEGTAVLQETLTTYNQNRVEHDEKSAAYALFTAKKEAVIKAYRKDRKKAKVVFHHDHVAGDKLGILKSVPGSFVGWLEQVKRFYTSALADADIQTALGRLKITSDTLTATNTLIAELEDARAAYLRERGESQDAVKVKDAAFQKLDEWMSDFYVVARIALEDHPQLLEALDKSVKS